MQSTFTLETVNGLLAVELMLQQHYNKGNNVTTYSNATQWYISWLTCPRSVAEPRRLGTDPDLISRRSSPALYWPKLRKQSSVKCFAQTDAFIEKIKSTHWFFRGADEGSGNRLLCSFVHANTEQLLCFARSQAMMSLLEITIAAHFIMGGQDKFSGRAKQRKGR